MRAEAVTGVVTDHGEGPVWDEREGRLLWVDMLRGDVLSFSPGDGDVQRTHVGDVAACVVPRTDGGFAVATERGFAFVGDELEQLPDIWQDSAIRMNDGACDPQGRFYCGSMAYDASPGRGALYRLDPDRSIHQVLTGVTISNGLGWSPAGDIAYYVDSPTRRIDAFDHDPVSGGLDGRRPFVTIPPESGMPDGLTIDAEGGIWVALWDGGAVHRYTAAGVLDSIVELPVSRPTSCAFGGDDLTELYISTSALGLSAEAEPLAGALFRVTPGVKGLPTARCAA